jgi:hypothetical protein
MSTHGLSIEEQVAAALAGSEEASEGDPTAEGSANETAVVGNPFVARVKDAPDDETEVDDFCLPPMRNKPDAGDDDDEDEDGDPSTLSPSVINPATVPHFNRPTTQVADDNGTERKKSLFGKMRGVGGLAKNVSKVAKISKGVGEGLGKVSRKGMKQMGSTLDKGKNLANKSLNVAEKGFKGMSQKTVDTINIGFDDMVVAGKGVKEMAGKGVNAVTQRGQLSAPAARQLRCNDIMFLLEDFKLQGGPYQSSMVIASSHGKMVEVSNGRIPRPTSQLGLVRAKWYRATGSGGGGGGAFEELEGTPSTNCYQPTAEDVGARVCCQLLDVEDEVR